MNIASTLLYVINIVYGFVQERLAGLEREEGYSVEIGYIKRPSSVTTFIHGQITVAPNETASEYQFVSTLCLHE